MIIKTIKCVCKNGDKITHILDAFGTWWTLNAIILWAMESEHRLVVEHAGQDVTVHLIHNEKGIPVAISTNPDSIEDNNLEEHQCKDMGIDCP